MIPIRVASLYKLLLCIVIVFIAACSSLPESDESAVYSEPVFESATITELLDYARDSEGPASGAFLIEAIELLLADQQIQVARSLTQQLPDPTLLDSELQTRYALINAQIALFDNSPDTALEYLTGSLIEPLNTRSGELQQQVYETRSRAYIASDQAVAGIQELIRFATLTTGDELQRAQDLIWQQLVRIDDQTLSAMASTATSYEMRGWIELARQIRAQKYSITNQLSATSRWRDTWNRHSAAAVLPASLGDLARIWARRPTHIALLLPLQDPIGVAVQEGFLSAYFQAMSQNDEVPQISMFDTSGTTEIRGIYDAATQSGADLIIGPLNKDLVQQLDNMARLPVPTLALNYTDQQDRNSDNLYQFGLAPEDEILQTAHLAWKAGYRNAAIVAPASPDYLRLQQQFVSIWRELGGELVTTANFVGESEYGDVIKQLLAIDASESRAARIRSLLPRNEIFFVPRRRQDIDFVFLMANPRQGRQLKPTLAFYFAGDIPVFALPAIYNGTDNPIDNQDLEGITFTDLPWVLQRDDAYKTQVDQTLRNVPGPLQRLRALGIDSFLIYPRLLQFAAVEMQAFRGTTGILSMTENGIFHRIPESARFTDGIAVQLD